MQVVTEKDLSKKRKPVQVYFNPEMVMLIQAKLKNSKMKMSMAEYIRVLVEDDLSSENKKVKPRKWLSVRGSNADLSSNAREIDKIVYGI